MFSMVQPIHPPGMATPLPMSSKGGAEAESSTTLFNTWSQDSTFRLRVFLFLLMGYHQQLKTPEQKLVESSKSYCAELS
ncbi:hypothetical protein BDL97_05G130000 [Sphagnum fallax]|nr:hypothetical protein BDL97_05G130000 [Sphagnum fallax]